MLDVRWKGLTPYSKALNTQLQHHEAVDEKGAVLLGYEHPQVITLGVRGNQAQDVLSQDGFEVVKVDRGGEATLHNPGQLVVYPVLSLKQLNLGAREYVELLQTVTQETLSQIGIQTFIKPGCPGVYTTRGKMASFGVRIKNKVTYHGLAINVCNNLQDFKSIKACGVLGALVDQVSFYSDITTKKLFFKWCENLKDKLKV